MSNKLQFMVGPPGTGKTSTFITSKYVELLKKVIRQGGLDEKPRVKYANIHKVKGLTFDNVIVDNSRFQPEDYFTQLRLKYVAYSRGKYDCWTIASQ